MRSFRRRMPMATSREGFDYLTSRPRSMGTLPGLHSAGTRRSIRPGSIRSTHSSSSVARSPGSAMTSCSAATPRTGNTSSASRARSTIWPRSATSLTKTGRRSSQPLGRRHPDYEGETSMPRASANNITMHYEQQGAGEPLILIPYLAADHACYAFQVPEYARHFTCISVDLRGTGESDKPHGAYTTEQLADDVAAFMQSAGIGRAHVAGLSLGGAIGLWLAAKYPDRVASLSLHSSWAKSDAFQSAVVES